MFNTPIEAFTAGMKINTINDSKDDSSSSSSSSSANVVTCNNVEVEDKDIKNCQDRESVASDVTQSDCLDRLRLHEESVDSSTANKQDKSGFDKNGVNRNLQCLTWSSDCTVR